MSLQKLLNDLNRQKDPEMAVNLARFFKTGPGEYGAGDQFLGLTVPQIRATVKQYWCDLSLSDTIQLLHNSFHGARQTAVLILVAKYQHGQNPDVIYQAYLDNTAHINNWDLVDSSAHKIVGDYLLTRPRNILYRLARSKSLWERRISIISTFAFIAKNDFIDALHLAKLFLHDTHDLIHKAVGWMLREVGKQDLPTLLSFLDLHASQMPRTMLRYAIEKLPAPERSRYLSLPRN